MEPGFWMIGVPDYLQLLCLLGCPVGAGDRRSDVGEFCGRARYRLR